MSSGPQQCGDCEAKTATLQCAACELLYCPDCDANIHRVGALKTHVRVALTVKKTTPCGACESNPQIAIYHCNECDVPYCATCYSSMHAKGARARHTNRPIDGASSGPTAAATATATPVVSSPALPPDAPSPSVPAVVSSPPPPAPSIDQPVTSVSSATSSTPATPAPAPTPVAAPVVATTPTPSPAVPTSAPVPAVALVPKTCSYQTTGPNFTAMRTWACITCKYDAGTVCCTNCMDQCHRQLGHEVKALKSGMVTQAYCDCGETQTCRSINRSLPIPAKKVTPTPTPVKRMGMMGMGMPRPLISAAKVATTPTPTPGVAAEPAPAGVAPMTVVNGVVVTDVNDSGYARVVPQAEHAARPTTDLEYAASVTTRIGTRINPATGETVASTVKVMRAGDYNPGAWITPEWGRPIPSQRCDVISKGITPHPMRMYHCNTCDYTEHEVHCEACNYYCHVAKGHDTYVLHNGRPVQGSCDCGPGGVASGKCAPCNIMNNSADAPLWPASIWTKDIVERFNEIRESLTRDITEIEARNEPVMKPWPDTNDIALAGVRFDFTGHVSLPLSVNSSNSVMARYSYRIKLLGPLTHETVGLLPIRGTMRWRQLTGGAGDTPVPNSDYHTDLIAGEFDSYSKKLTLFVQFNGNHGNGNGEKKSSAGDEPIRVLHKSLTFTLVRDGLQMVGGVTLLQPSSSIPSSPSPSTPSTFASRQLQCDWSPVTLDHVKPPTIPLPVEPCLYATNGPDGPTPLINVYTCLTCEPSAMDRAQDNKGQSSYNMCEQCARYCHSGHKVVFVRWTNLQICQCGSSLDSSRHVPCRSMECQWVPRAYGGQLVPAGLRCQVAVAKWSRLPNLQLMQAWHCLDCMVIPQADHNKPVMYHTQTAPPKVATVCCKTCMLLCHRGHRLVLLDQGRPIFGVCQCQAADGKCRARVYAASHEEQMKGALSSATASAHAALTSQLLAETKSQLMIKYNPTLLPLAPFDVVAQKQRGVLASMPVPVPTPTPTPVPSVSVPVAPGGAAVTPSTPTSLAPVVVKDVAPIDTHCYNTIDDTMIVPTTSGGSGAYSYTETGGSLPRSSTSSLYDGASTTTTTSSLYDTAQDIIAARAKASSSSPSSSSSAYSVGADLLDAMQIANPSQQPVVPLSSSIAANTPTPAPAASTPSAPPSGYVSPYSGVGDLPPAVPVTAVSSPTPMPAVSGSGSGIPAGYSSPYDNVSPVLNDGPVPVVATPSVVTTPATIVATPLVPTSTPPASGYSSPYDNVSGVPVMVVANESTQPSPAVAVPTPTPASTPAPGSAYDTMATVMAALGGNNNSNSGGSLYDGSNAYGTATTVASFTVAVPSPNVYHQPYASTADVVHEEKKSVPPIVNAIPVPSPSSVAVPATGASVSSLVDPSAPITISKPVGYRDFNGEFQDLLSLPTSTTEERIRRLVAINILTRQFSTVATKIAMTIVEELSLPDEQRTYRAAADIGGVAGGEKYIVDGIFIKFAKDWKNLYGGDQYAAKSASLELNGIKSYLSLNIRGLHAPLVILIDYLGHRLTATSLLPLSKGSLVYGSGDGGETVQHSNPRCNALMKQAGHLLNLKGHYVGEDRNELIYGPGDIEVHLGRDNRLYVIDAARTFPPEATKMTIPLLSISCDDAKQLQVTDAIKGRLMNEASRMLPLPAQAMSTNGLFGIFQKDDGTGVNNTLNKRASLLAGYQIKGDAIFLPNPRGAHLYALLRPEFIRNYGRGRPPLPTFTHGLPQWVYPSITGDMPVPRQHEEHIRVARFTAHQQSIATMEQQPRTPLSSDAFTFFGSHDAHIHNREVSEATESLMSRTLHAFARLCVSRVCVPTSGIDLVRAMHSVGINVRYLGKIRGLIQGADLTAHLLADEKKDMQFRMIHVSRMILTEMTVRVWKNVLRSKMRSTSAAHIGVTGPALRTILINMLVTELNYIVGGHTPPVNLDSHGRDKQRPSAIHALATYLPDGSAWNDFVKTHIQLKFGMDNSALTQQERATGFDLAENLLKVPLLVDLCGVLGIQLKATTIARLQRNPTLFNGPLPLTVSDVTDLTCQIDSMMNPYDALSMIQSNVLQPSAATTDTLALAASPAFVDNGVTHDDEPSIESLVPEDIELTSGHYLDLNPSIWWRRQIARQRAVTDEVERLCGANSIEYSTSLAELARLYSGLAMSIEEEGPSSIHLPPLTPPSSTPATVDNGVKSNGDESKSTIVDVTKPSSPSSSLTSTSSSSVGIASSMRSKYGEALGLSSDDMKSMITLGSEVFRQSLHSLSDIENVSGREQTRRVLDTDVDEHTRQRWHHEMERTCETAVTLAKRVVTCARQSETSAAIPLELLAKVYVTLGEVQIARRIFDSALSCLYEAFTIMTNTFGVPDSTRKQNDPGAGGHPAMMLIIERLVYVMNRCDLAADRTMFTTQFGSLILLYAPHVMGSARRQSIEWRRWTYRRAFGREMPSVLNSSNGFKEFTVTSNAANANPILPLWLLDSTQRNRACPPTGLTIQQDLDSALLWIRKVLMLEQPVGKWVMANEEILANVPAIRHANWHDVVMTNTNVGALYTWDRNGYPAVEVKLPPFNSNNNGGPASSLSPSQSAPAPSVPLIRAMATQHDFGSVVACDDGSIYGIQHNGANPRTLLPMCFGIPNVKDQPATIPGIAIPVSLMAGKIVTQVAVGRWHMLLLSEGNVFSCGDGKDGALGHGDSEERRAPRMISSLAGQNVVQIIAALQHSMARTNDGRVYSWGDNQWGCLGIGQVSTTPRVLVPSLALYPRPISWITTTDHTTIAISRLGDLYRCGDFYWIYDGPVNRKNGTPILIDFQPRAVQAELGQNHCIILDDHGRVHTMGRGNTGGHNGMAVLGHGHNENVTRPTLVHSLGRRRIVRIAAGKEVSYAITSTGQLWTWGNMPTGPIMPPNGTAALPLVLDRMNTTRILPVQSAAIGKQAVADVACHDGRAWAISGIPRSMLPLSPLPPRDWTTLISLSMSPSTKDVIAGSTIIITWQLPHYATMWDGLYLIQLSGVTDHASTKRCERFTTIERVATAAAASYRGVFECTAPTKPGVFEWVYGLPGHNHHLPPHPCCRLRFTVIAPPPAT